MTGIFLYLVVLSFFKILIKEKEEYFLKIKTILIFLKSVSLVLFTENHKISCYYCDYIQSFSNRFSS